MSIKRENLITVCCSDIAGQVRGKGFAVAQLGDRRRFGVGWTPGNVMLNCFNLIPPSPFGVSGDLMLIPSSDGDFVLDYGDGSPVEHSILGDIVTMKGEPWECCTRAFLRRALDALEKAGFRLFSSFEHEFWLEGAEQRAGNAYGISKLRGIEELIGDFLGALRANGIPPDTFLPEGGFQQFEVTVEPSIGMFAADHAVKLREILRSVARRHGRRVSFSPVIKLGGVGTGLHLHFSLLDMKGRPVFYQPGNPGDLSAIAASFAAGIVRHARALCAVTAPSFISYERLKPNSWSACYANLAYRHREAMVRICPYPEAEGVDIAKRFNLEFRAADSAGSPYLQLGMLVYAGLAGIKDSLPAPDITARDLDALSPAERAKLGIKDLPRSLSEALDALEADAEAMSWLGPVLSKVYVMHKRGEIAACADRDMGELCSDYALAY